MKKLLDRGFKVKALTRSKSKASSILGKSELLDIVEVDLKDKQGLTDKGIFEACEGALICTGTTAFPTARCVLCAWLHGGGVAARFGTNPGLFGMHETT